MSSNRGVFVFLLIQVWKFWTHP